MFLYNTIHDDVWYSTFDFKYVPPKFGSLSLDNHDRKIFILIFAVTSVVFGLENKSRVCKFPVGSPLNHGRVLLSTILQFLTIDSCNRTSRSHPPSPLFVCK